MKKGDPDACWRFLEEYAPELHPNHYYLTDVRIALAQLHGQTDDTGLPGVSDRDLTEKISLCRQVLALINALVPGKLQLLHLYIRRTYSRIHHPQCKLNSVALVRKQTILTERSPLVGEVSANFCRYRVLRGQRNEFPRQIISVF
jgi:hypothetical protein